MPPARPSAARRRSRGTSYIEVLVAVLLVSVALAPALDALRTSVAGTGVQRAHTVRQERLKARMETVLANWFNTLDAAALAAGNSPSAISSTYSDAAGTPDRIVVTLYRHNGSAATSADTGLLWVKVAMQGSPLELNTFISR